LLLIINEPLCFALTGSDGAISLLAFVSIRTTKFLRTSYDQTYHRDTLLWRHDIQHKDTQHKDIKHIDTRHNDIQHNDTQRNGLICDIQHIDTQHNGLICDTQHK
jgi:hypothetical protein